MQMYCSLLVNVSKLYFHPLDLTTTNLVRCDFSGRIFQKKPFWRKDLWCICYRSKSHSSAVKSPLASVTCDRLCLLMLCSGWPCENHCLNTWPRGACRWIRDCPHLCKAKNGSDPSKPVNFISFCRLRCSCLCVTRRAIWKLRLTSELQALWPTIRPSWPTTSTNTLHLHLHQSISYFKGNRKHCFANR